MKLTNILWLAIASLGGYFAYQKLFLKVKFPTGLIVAVPVWNIDSNSMLPYIAPPLAATQWKISAPVNGISLATPA